MAFYLDLFSPETHQAFASSNRTVTGFRLRQQRVASRVQPGDVLVCYLTRLTRWCGLLDVVGGPFVDDSAILRAEQDPFVVRFHVRPRVWLAPDESIPMHDESIWQNLSFTSKLDKGSIGWTGKVCGSLVQLDERDGRLLDNLLSEQSVERKRYELDEHAQKQITTAHCQLVRQGSLRFGS